MIKINFSFRDMRGISKRITDENIDQNLSASEVEFLIKNVNERMEECEVHHVSIPSHVLDNSECIGFTRTFEVRARLLKLKKLTFMSIVTTYLYNDKETVVDYYELEEGDING